MFCANCGNQIKPELNYCNRCGGKIEKINGEYTQTSFQSISTVIGVVGLGGMIVILIFALKLLKENVDISAIVVIIAMFLATILAIIYMTIRLMPQYLDQPKTNEKSFPDFVPPNQLGSAKTARLEEQKQQPASVIENTTRTLDEVFVNKN
jgi:uncharacterized membrane protein YvbJ